MNKKFVARELVSLARSIISERPISAGKSVTAGNVIIDAYKATGWSISKTENITFYNDSIEITTDGQCFDVTLNELIRKGISVGDFVVYDIYEEELCSLEGMEKKLMKELESQKKEMGDEEIERLTKAGGGNLLKGYIIDLLEDKCVTISLFKFTIPKEWTKMINYLSK